jgi:hypothetical protein
MVQAPSLIQFLIVMLAAWLARQQEAFIEYLKGSVASSLAASESDDTWSA